MCVDQGIHLTSRVRHHAGQLVVDATRSGNTIEEVALELWATKVTQEDVCGTGQKTIALPHLPAAAILNFAGERADLAWQLADKLLARLREHGLEPLYRDLELPLVPVLADIERHGIRIDQPALASQSHGSRRAGVRRSRFLN